MSSTMAQSRQTGIGCAFPNQTSFSLRSLPLSLQVRLKVLRDTPQDTPLRRSWVVSSNRRCLG